MPSLFDFPLPDPAERIAANIEGHDHRVLILMEKALALKIKRENQPIDPNEVTAQTELLQTSTDALAATTAKHL